MDKKSRVYKKCEVCGIRRYSNSNLFMTQFPLDPHRCRLWVQSIGMEDLAYLPIEKLHQLKYVCGSHFSSDCFNKKGNRLNKSALPTLNLINPPLTNNIMKNFPLQMKKNSAPKRGASKEQCDSKINKKNKTSVSDIKLQDALMECTNTTRPKYYIAPVTGLCDKENVQDHVTALTEKCESSSQFTPIASSSKAPEHLTYERKIDHAVAPNEEFGSNSQFIPIASSSKAPEHLTYKRKIDDNALGEPEKIVLIQQYKRWKISLKGKPHQMTVREKQLLKRLENAKVTIKTLAATSINLDKVDSDSLKTILSNTIKNQNRKPQGKRWGLKNKVHALAIFKRSPKAYRYLRNHMPLPSEKTLQRMLKGISLEPGIYKNILANISRKVSEMQNVQNKYCALLFDEIALKKRLIYNEITDKVEGYVDLGCGEGMGRCNKVADHALVFMLQGLRVKFKQPIAHFFVEGTIASQKLASIIKNIIRNVSDAGLTIVNTVCDQGPTNVGALNLLKSLDGLHKDCHYFIVDSTKYFIIYDIPHLFKSVRNNFYNAGLIKYDGRLGQWSHLKEAEEKNRSFLNFKKLTPLVVNPNYKVKMKVKYAAHALSNTTVAILKMLAWKDDNAEAIRETAFVVEKLDRLFDCTNGPASSKDIKKGIRENVSAKTSHVESWNHYLKIMDSVKFINFNNNELKNVRCIKGFQISLNSLKDIWNLLHKEAGFKYLNLRQLNQDSLENLFGNIRQHSVTNKNPTCSHFTAALKTSIISGLTAPHSRGSNCEADENQLFINYKQIEKENQKEYEILEEIELQKINDICYPVLSLPEEPDLECCEKDLYSFEDQPVVYVSGYLAAKILNKSSCINCKKHLSIDDPKGDDELYNYISFREWWQDKKSLTYPTKKLCTTVQDAKQYYEKYLAQETHKINIGQECFLQLRINCSFTWFQCQQHFEEVTENLIRTLSYLFVRKSCKITNDKYKINESNLPAKNKKMQQQSKEE